jgi:hypothetical protein
LQQVHLQAQQQQQQELQQHMQQRQQHQMQYLEREYSFMDLLGIPTGVAES